MARLYSGFSNYVRWKRLTQLLLSILLISTSFTSRILSIHAKFPNFFEEKWINSLQIREIKTSNARSTSISTRIALIRAGWTETERGDALRRASGRMDASGPRSQGLAWRRRCSKLGTCLAREEGGWRGRKSESARGRMAKSQRQTAAPFSLRRREEETNRCYKRVCAIACRLSVETYSRVSARVGPGMASSPVRTELEFEPTPSRHRSHGHGLSTIY